ncbi:hypothetical protein [Mucilaginibacter ginsenosidivorans]|uniref:hypothetical protein n=1 Tax=Mucilaginibacter ginsenosidivorans TaxID=398053 RepID=UPI001E44C9A6|nr:hypothetical protein [Mucilaginibacter ginsenosidivorans]
MLISSAVFAQQKPIPLYPNGVPNSKPAPETYKEKRDGYSISMVTDPTITPYFPAKGTATGTAIVIFPGGSYITPFPALSSKTRLSGGGIRILSAECWPEGIKYR